MRTKTNKYITKLVRCHKTSKSWGIKGNEAYVTAKTVNEIANMIPGTWKIINEPVSQAPRPGIRFLKKFDSQT